MLSINGGVDWIFEHRQHVLGVWNFRPVLRRREAALDHRLEELNVHGIGIELASSARHHPRQHVGIGGEAGDVGLDTNRFLEQRDVLRLADRVAMNNDVEGPFERLGHLRTRGTAAQRQYGKRGGAEA